jgi:hypothetical protein
LHIEMVFVLGKEWPAVGPKQLLLPGGGLCH